MTTKLLATVVDEVLSLSSCSPRITNLMREVFYAHYATHTLVTSDHYPDISDALYGMNDNKMYSIVSISFVDEYMFFLLPAEQVSPRNAIREIIIQIKKEYSFTNLELGKVIEHVHAMKSMLQEIMDSSTRSTRKATGLDKSAVEPVLPNMDELKRFYECGRKTQYFSSEDMAGKLSGVNGVYDCLHCGNLHQGQKPTGMTVPLYIMEGRYKTTWRRYHGI